MASTISATCVLVRSAATGARMPAAVTVATVAEPVATRMRTATTQARNSTDSALPSTASAMTCPMPVLISTGIGQVIADAVEGSALSVLFLAWVVAVLIRVATGSATVATVTAAGILAPVAADLTSTHVALMVLAIGSGSLFLSHVNDAGFWLVKGY